VTKSWIVPVLKIDPPTNPMALADLVPLLARLIAAFGTKPVAELLDVDEGMLEPWMARRQKIEYDIAKRVLALHEVMTRALQIHQARTAMDWLVGNDPFLNHARPIDVMVLRGSAPLIEALEAFDSGGFA
jgi:uncharacterized protein (DUF2384 family)